MSISFIKIEKIDFYNREVYLEYINININKNDRKILIFKNEKRYEANKPNKIVQIKLLCKFRLQKL
jgi:hypothetical protein